VEKAFDVGADAADHAVGWPVQRDPVRPIKLGVEPNARDLSPTHAKKRQLWPAEYLFAAAEQPLKNLTLERCKNVACSVAHRAWSSNLSNASNETNLMTSDLATQLSGCHL
jgi:hypothetical protein